MWRGKVRQAKGEVCVGVTWLERHTASGSGFPRCTVSLLPGQEQATPSDLVPATQRKVDAASMLLLPLNSPLKP